MRMDKPVFLEGEKVYLRPLDMDDLDTFHRWFNHPDLRKWLYLTYPITKGDEKETLEKMIKDKDSVYLSIVIKSNDKLIGNLSLHKIHKVHKSAELGIAIGDSEETSKGYGTEAMKLLIDYGFNTLNLHRIQLWVHDFNKRAIGSYEKLGFVQEGKKRESFYSDGKYTDGILMAILRKEWKAK
jgi:RimJ/RimL family protein N-acetyltransferase